MASRALMTRFTRICSSCVLSASTGVRSGQISVLIWMSAPISRCSIACIVCDELIERNRLLRDHLRAG